MRGIDRHLDLEGVRAALKPFYSSTGRPSVDPELMIRMLLVGYCLGIRSERRLCEVVHLNLAYRWSQPPARLAKWPEHRRRTNGKRRGEARRAGRPLDLLSG